MSEERVSLTAMLEVIDQYREDQILQAVGRLYEMSSGRGIFNEKFVSQTDLMSLGYQGLRRMLQSLYETDADFVLANFGELRTLILMLKGVDQ